MTLVWRPGYGGAAVSDPDAMAYLRAVEEADNQPLEQGVQQAVNQFVIGCKNDGIWDAIKASCILAGARTLDGALVPLVGTAPTNYNFVSGDYNRKTGLVGNGSTKYLDSNRAGDADPQDNFHMSCYNSTAHDPSVAGNSGRAVIGNGFTNIAGSTHIGVLGGSDPNGYRTFVRNRSATLDTPIGPTRDFIVFQGISRSNPSDYAVRVGGSNYILTRSSESPLSLSHFVFARNNAGSLSAPSNARLAFYSIGESLDLALLDTRVSDLITAIGAAIP